MGAQEEGGGGYGHEGPPIDQYYTTRVLWEHKKREGEEMAMKDL